MTESKPALPQPQLQPAGITFEQYVEFTPEKLELSDGYLGYGGQNQLGFHLAVLTNMGLLSAIRHTNLNLWIEVLDNYVREKLVNIDAESEETEEMFSRLNRAINDLAAVVEYLQEKG
ncbi:MAG: hypothetical protein KI793_31955 [Rivularia sp. (in: Bacteria)]|nr:hypothetical protein [Rivularia sp. MS3]